MRILTLVFLVLLAGCQTARDNPKNQYMGQYAPSGVFGYGDGSVGTFGKAWGDNGKEIATRVAYRRLYEFASRNGYKLYYFTSEKSNHVEKGTKTLFPMATKDKDYHSVRLTARLFTGSLAAPRRAVSVDILRERFDPGFVRSLVPENDLDDTDLLADLDPANNPVDLKPARPLSKLFKRKKIEQVPEEPLVILAPES